MGFFGKLFQGPTVDQAKSDASRARMRTLFDQVVEQGGNYRLVHAITQDASRFNFGFVSGSKTKIGNFIVGWNEADATIVAVPTVPDLSGCGDPQYFRRGEIHKAYRSKVPTDSFVIYPDKSGYVALEVYDWLDDAKLYAYVDQAEDVKAFTAFFTTAFATK